MTHDTIEAARTGYDRDGFHLFREPVLPEDVVRRAVAGMDALRRGEYDTGTPPEESPWNPGDDPGKLCKIEMPQFASRAILELVSHPALGDLVGRLTGAQWVHVWWVQLLYKPPQAAKPGDDTSIGWHTDRQYHCPPWTTNSELFTAWVALSDVTARSGPMKFVPGSHRTPVGDDGGDFFAQDLAAQRETIRLPDATAWREVEAVLPPGGVSVHHRGTLHGSGPNVSDAARKSFAIHMRTDQSWTEDESRIGLTEFLDDERCPIVYGA
jgi:hypothetical protein